eukprot:COSAG02_NODE_2934_length_7705_cov_11.991191_8_plen_107_part_00
MLHHHELAHHASGCAAGGDSHAIWALPFGTMHRDRCFSSVVHGTERTDPRVRRRRVCPRRSADACPGRPRGHRLLLPPLSPLSPLSLLQSLVSITSSTSSTSIIYR